MIKKIITFILLISIYSYTYAKGACPIKDNTPSFLEQYIKDSKNEIKDITKNITDREENGTIDRNLGEYLGAKKLLVQVINEVFNFKSYYAGVEYNAVFPLFEEVPKEIKRDYKMLKEYDDALLKYVEKLSRSHPTKAEVGKITELVRRNNKVLTMFKQTVTGKKENDVLIGNDFYKKYPNFDLELKKNYGEKARVSCSREEGGFAWMVEEAKKIINTNFELAKSGVKVWKEAFQMLNGSVTGTDEANEKEQELYKKRLSKLGIETDNKKILEKNLKKTNSNGISANNNFVTNSFNNAEEEISSEFKKWKSETIGTVFEGKDTTPNKVIKSRDNAKITIDIGEKIAELYEKELPFATASNINTEKLRAKIIQTHINLEQSIKTLEKTIKVSQNVCKSQDRGSGKCE